MLKRIMAFRFSLFLFLTLFGCFGCASQGIPGRTPSIHAGFEAGSLGRVEAVGPNRFRCHVAGQSDARGRNRQASWYYFRVAADAEQELAITLTDFVGEYNDRPGACPMNGSIRPVYSYDNRDWRHFEDMTWDEETREATLRLRPERSPIWVAHVPPYPWSRITSLLEELRRSPVVRVEVIGHSVGGRELHLIDIPGAKPVTGDRPTIWIVARQHAWEAPTSHVLEGALRFLTSDTPRAARLRERVRFMVVPTMDPDGCAAGAVRFNAMGCDLNRHWDEVTVEGSSPSFTMPEIGCVKRAIRRHLNAGGRIDLLLNLHNTETGEFLETLVDDPDSMNVIRRFHELLLGTTSFDPSRGPDFSRSPTTTMNELWEEWRVPVVLMEQRIAPGARLGQHPTVEDRLAFGQAMVQCAAEAVEGRGAKASNVLP